MNILKQAVETRNEKGEEYKIQFTRRYDLFKSLSGNRPLNANHAMQVMKSMRTNGSLLTPIIVNENMEIIDGQHRLYAFENLKREVPYLLVRGYGAREMQVMNQTQQNWKPLDFMNYFAKKDYNDYVRLRNFMNDNPKLQLSSAVFLLSPKEGLGTMVEIGDGRMVNKFEFGKFEINNWTQAVYIASYLAEMVQFLERKAGSSTFTKIIYELCTKYEDSFSLDRFMDKLPLMAHELRAQGSLRGYLGVINTFYWHHTPKKDRVDFVVK